MSLEFLRRASKEYDRYLVTQAQLKQQSAQPTPESHSETGTGKPVVATTVTPRGAGTLKFRPNILQQIIRALFHAVQFAVAYFIMFLAMYYNGYIIISIIIGAFLGSFVFSCKYWRRTFSYSGQFHDLLVRQRINSPETFLMR
jgi:copper transporter 1